MAGYDILALAVVGLAVIFGLWKGFLHQLLKVIAIGGGYAALHFAQYDITRFISKTGMSEEAGHYAAVLVAVFGAYIIMSIITHLLRAPIHKAAFGGLDKILGGVLGIAKGVGLLAVITFGIIAVPGLPDQPAKAYTDFEKTKIFNDSWAAPRMVVGMGYARPLFHDRFFKVADEDLGLVKK